MTQMCQAQFMNDRDVRVEDLSLSDLVGQTMVLPLYGSSATNVTTEQAAANRSIYGEALPSEIIERFRPGGVLLIDRIAFHPGFEHLPLGNAQTASQLVEYTSTLQEAARSAGMPGLLIVADQEGGRVNQLPVPALPVAAVVGSTGRPDLARRAGELTGRIARSLGVNVLFYPVADVGASNSAIGDRAFGSDVDLVAEMVKATVEGITEAGVGAAVKHWPGHGRADADSHKSLPRLNVGMADWHDVELPPFRAAVEAKVDAVVVAHLSFPAADPTGRAASTSPRLVQLLRRETGFRGVVFSDALWMPSIRQSSSSDAETATAVLAAGIDLLLAPPDPRGTITHIGRSVERNEIRSMLERAVNRSLALRRSVARYPKPTTPPPDWSAETQQLTLEIRSASPRP